MASTTSRWHVLLPFFEAAFPNHSAAALLPTIDAVLTEHPFCSLADAFFNLDLLFHAAAQQLDPSAVPHRVDFLNLRPTWDILYNTLTAFLRHHFARFHFEDRRDAIQYAFLSLWETAPLKVRTSPRKLWRYAYRAACNYLLRQDRYYQRFAPEDPALLITHQTPEDVVAARYEWEQLQRWIQRQYGDQSFQLFRLWAAGWTLKELAHRFAMSPSAVYRVIKEILHHIR